ncbi:MAG: hypothetical protein HY589_05360 [Candidatus Omnitrophica bacterium]|nr:hypothetical protein [Candidatus Omnitrophota bacterium]
MTRKGLTKIEFAAGYVIICVIACVMFVYFSRTLRPYREAVLKNQLMDIRLSLKLYQLFHNEYPWDIRVLLSEEVGFKPAARALKKKYVEYIRSDAQGFPIDPFGNRFAYAPGSGGVRSQTRGYEKW